MEEHAQNGREYSGKCYISQSACMEDAKAVAQLVEETFPKLDGKVQINNIGTVIGSHTGPGTVALYSGAMKERCKKQRRRKKRESIWCERIEKDVP